MVEMKLTFLTEESANSYGQDKIVIVQVGTSQDDVFNVGIAKAIKDEESNNLIGYKFNGSYYKDIDSLLVGASRKVRGQLTNWLLNQNKS